jgi:hypothetical protein
MSASGVKQPSSRARALVALAALVFASGVAGAAIERVVTRPPSTARLGDTTFHPLSSILRSPTPQDHLRYRLELSQSLGLSAAQDAAIDSIMSTRAGEFNALREEIRPRVDLLVTSVRDDIERTLTAEQREKFRALQRRDRQQLVSNGKAP